MKITIIYSKDGLTIADQKVPAWVNKLVKCYRSGKIRHYTVKIGNAVVFDALRVEVMCNRISYQDIVFSYKGKEIKVDRNGAISYWPLGFCDATEKYCMQLIEGRNPSPRTCDYTGPDMHSQGFPK